MCIRPVAEAMDDGLCVHFFPPFEDDDFAGGLLFCCTEERAALSWRSAELSWFSCCGLNLFRFELI